LCEGPDNKPADHTAAFRIDMTNAKLTAMEREALRWQQEGHCRLGGHLTERPDPQGPLYAPVHSGWHGLGRAAHRAGERLRRVFRAMVSQIVRG